MAALVTLMQCTLTTTAGLGGATWPTTAGFESAGSHAHLRQGGYALPSGDDVDHRLQIWYDHSGSPLASVRVYDVINAAVVMGPVEVIDYGSGGGRWVPIASTTIGTLPNGLAQVEIQVDYGGGADIAKYLCVHWRCARWVE